MSDILAKILEALEKVKNGENLPDNGFLEELRRRNEEAKKARPDVAAEDLIFSIFGDEKPQSVHEVNERKEPALFACIRCEDASLDCVVNGSTWKRCNFCNSLVWMSPATEQTMNKLVDTKIICLRCMAEKAHENKV